MIIHPCPFCGSKPEGCFYGWGGVNVTAVNCSNRDCIASARQVSIEQWNTRHEYTPESDPFKEKYEKLLAFIEKARLESDLITIQRYRDDIKHKIQVPYWFMRNPD